MSAEDTVVFLLLLILLVRNAARTVCLSLKTYCQSESVAIVVMRMSIMYANSAEPCMTI